MPLDCLGTQLGALISHLYRWQSSHPLLHTSGLLTKTVTRVGLCVGDGPVCTVGGKGASLQEPRTGHGGSGLKVGGKEEGIGALYCCRYGGRGGCGEFYCSETCQKSMLEKGHGMLCMGPLGEDDTEAATF